MRDFTTAPPIKVNVQTTSMGSHAIIAHRIKSQKQFQKIKSNIDSRLTDYNIYSNLIQNDFVLSSDHPLQPTNFVNTIEELKGSNNHDKHLDEIDKEFQQVSELRLLRTRIEQIFNREMSKYTSQDNISLTSQFSLKYNDILDETSVPYDKDGQRDEEIEIRSLTRKIEQIFDEELRRFRPITW